MGSLHHRFLRFNDTRSFSPKVLTPRSWSARTCPLRIFAAAFLLLSVTLNKEEFVCGCGFPWSVRKHHIIGSRLLLFLSSSKGGRGRGSLSQHPEQCRLLRQAPVSSLCPSFHTETMNRGALRAGEKALNMEMYFLKQNGAFEGPSCPRIWTYLIFPHRQTTSPYRHEPRRAGSPWVSADEFSLQAKGVQPWPRRSFDTFIHMSWMNLSVPPHARCPVPAP